MTATSGPFDPDLVAVEARRNLETSRRPAAPPRRRPGTAVSSGLPGRGTHRRVRDTWRLSPAVEAGGGPLTLADAVSAPSRLGPSRRVAHRLARLFPVDVGGELVTTGFWPTTCPSATAFR